MSEQSYEFVEESVVRASPAAVWARVSTMAGVNDELWPLARMTHPRGATLAPDAVPLGRRAFRSWILVLGILPLDYDDLTVMRVDPGRGFLEESPLLSQRRWVHERTLETVAGGCRIRDRIRFEPRVALFGPLYLRVFRLFFRHRHRRLRRAFPT